MSATFLSVIYTQSALENNLIWHYTKTKNDSVIFFYNPDTEMLRCKQVVDQITDSDALISLVNNVWSAFIAQKIKITV
jgi:hypothetical protein